MNNTINFAGFKYYPSKIVCVGRNYVAHIHELDNEIPSEPVIFIKPNSSISNEIYTHKTDDIHYEGEISFLIKAGCIAGVGFGLDLTKRTIQSKLKNKGLPWERAKAFDRSAVFSDFVSIPEDLSELRMELHINSHLKQDGSIQLMLHKPEFLVNEIKSFMTLEDGDVLMSGTPSGVGIIYMGDSFTGKIFSGVKLLVEHTWLVEKIF